MTGIRRHVLVACDSFKGTLTAVEANDSVKRGLQRAYSLIHGSNDGLHVECHAMSDGGEGWLHALTPSLQLNIHNVTVTGPLCKPVKASYGVHGDLAVIEMAQASGFELVPDTMKNPLATTSYGVGELLSIAYSNGARRFIVGVGGSATNDGGLGALQALGLRLKMERGWRAIDMKKHPDLYIHDKVQDSDVDIDALPREICGRHLQYVTELMWPDGKDACILPGAEMVMACDVRNPFVGVDGATAIFSRQKGAVLPEQRDELERGMIQLASLLETLTGKNISNMPGAGTAGGISGSFAASLNAQLVSGMKIMADNIGLDSIVGKSDLVVTGEGSYDAQTKEGKVASYLQTLCAQLNIPFVVVCGVSKLEEDDNIASNVHQMVSLFPKDQCIKHSARCLEDMVAQKAVNFPQFR